MLWLELIRESLNSISRIEFSRSNISNIESINNTHCLQSWNGPFRARASRIGKVWVSNNPLISEASAAFPSANLVFIISEIIENAQLPKELGTETFIHSYNLPASREKQPHCIDWRENISIFNILICIKPNPATRRIQAYVFQLLGIPDIVLSFRPFKLKVQL